MSQSSRASTVPYDITHNQDEDFIDELNLVDTLYFCETSNHSGSNQVDGPGASCLVGFNSESDSSDSDINYESDSSSSDDDFILNDVCLDPSAADNCEYIQQAKFRNNTCGCKEFYGKPCSTVIDFQSVIDFRESCKEFSRDELDIAIKAELFCHRHAGQLTEGSKHVKKQRQRPFQEFYFKGQRVCRALFCFLHGIDKKKLQAIGRSLDSEGLKPRTHGNKGKSPSHSLSLIDRERIKNFITRYARDNGLPLPGRLPHFRESHVVVLPSDKSVSDIHTVYNNLADVAKFRKVSLRTFQRLWQEMCPHVTICKPATDLCQKCQSFCHKLNNGGLLEDEDKSTVLEQYQKHLSLTKNCRYYYREQCLESKENYSLLPLALKSEENVPCSVDTIMHYSWDYAQQVHIPHNSQQVGPVYFKTPRKCGVFGVCCEGSGKQVFYLIDEGDSPGKGANSVISMVDHYFYKYGIGERHARLHFDNCCGQNKNNAVLWYALWRVLTGLHDTIEMSTMIAGHTKFEPDWHFGIWKNKWRKSNAETLEEVAKTVNLSSKHSHNTAQLVNDCDFPVSFSDWKTFLSGYFKILKNLSQYHHFFVSSLEPGIVKCRKEPASHEESFMLMKVRPDKCSQPTIIERPGLSAARQWYLYEQIREHCLNEGSKEKTCPEPLIPKPKVKLEMSNTAWKETGQCKRKSSLLN